VENSVKSDFAFFQLQLLFLGLDYDLDVGNELNQSELESVVLCAAVAISYAATYPEGVASQSPGCERSELPWDRINSAVYAEGVASTNEFTRMQRRWRSQRVVEHFAMLEIGTEPVDFFLFGAQLGFDEITAALAAGQRE